MGVFSEIAMDTQEREPNVVAPFTLEQAEQEPIEAFADEAKQQAEADAAPAALAYLTKQEDPDGDDSDEEGEEPGEEKTTTPDQKKKEHEEAEAKRKAEWEAKQAAKEEADLMAWETAVAVSDDELMKASLKRIGTDSERLTRRNMKVCVTEHIQTKCYEDMAFARQTLHPRKNMVNCFHYINRKAREFAEQEMKDNDEKPMNGAYGTDVPDGLCYKWAEDYFGDLDAEEDKDKDDKFVPKTFSGGGSTSKSKKPAAKKPEKKPVAKIEAPAPADNGQLSLGEQTSLLGVPA